MPFLTCSEEKNVSFLFLVPSVRGFSGTSQIKNTFKESTYIYIAQVKYAEIEL